MMSHFSFVRRAAFSAAVLGLAAGAVRAQDQTKTKTKSSAGKVKTAVSTNG